jgi:hypothetical protein
MSLPDSISEDVFEFMREACPLRQARFPSNARPVHLILKRISLANGAGWIQMNVTACETRFSTKLIQERHA